MRAGLRPLPSCPPTVSGRKCGNLVIARLACPRPPYLSGGEDDLHQPSHRTVPPTHPATAPRHPPTFAEPLRPPTNLPLYQPSLGAVNHGRPSWMTASLRTSRSSLRSNGMEILYRQLEKFHARERQVHSLRPSPRTRSRHAQHIYPVRVCAHEWSYRLVGLHLRAHTPVPVCPQPSQRGR
ncbi:hypothetical protein GY45DRAFT_1004969 [Cubamyces sp. BRFM 1775]|nr:hypothetical protein GY45DRAFT_1004969 [Cubamyces sp. BRFM 1775]